eukprot:5776567-Amphidinium_carterae.1
MEMIKNGEKKVKNESEEVYSKVYLRQRREAKAEEDLEGEGSYEAEAAKQKLQNEERYRLNSSSCGECSKQDVRISVAR